MKSYRIHNQKLLLMLHGSGCFTGHVSRFLEKSPPGSQRQEAAKEKKYIPSLAAVAAITAIAAKIKNIEILEYKELLNECR